MVSDQHWQRRQDMAIEYFHIQHEMESGTEQKKSPQIL